MRNNGPLKLVGLGIGMQKSMAAASVLLVTVLLEIQQDVNMYGLRHFNSSFQEKAPRDSSKEAFLLTYSDLRVLAEKCGNIISYT